MVRFVASVSCLIPEKMPPHLGPSSFLQYKAYITNPLQRPPPVQSKNQTKSSTGRTVCVAANAASHALLTPARRAQW